MESAQEYMACKCISETWEILRYLNNVLYRLKFEDEKAELEKSFRDATGYDLAMSEGANTKRDKKLMSLRQVQHAGRDYDITPHVKHGNQAPKMVRVHFDFDEELKKIIVGYIGPHIPNATTKSM